MDGVLVCDKPAGPTSHDVVAIVRRALEIDRVGHTGTLDPLATGVLALVIGRATRLASFMSGAEKEYLATIRFGTSTATYDAEGKSGRADSEPATDSNDERGPLPNEGAVLAALPAFRGTFSQMPPAFSAKKIAGVPAYKLARKQKPVKLEPVQVTVRELELCRFEGDRAELRMITSSGFYVRSLAHDLGQRLGCGAHLADLRRTRVGSFTIAEATPLGAIQAEGTTARARIVPLDRLLPDLPAVFLTDQGAKRSSHGNAVRPEDVIRTSGVPVPWVGASGEGPKTRVRLLDGSGTLLAIAEADGAVDGLLHPTVVLV